MRLIVFDRWGHGKGDITQPVKAIVKRTMGGSDFSDTLELTCDMVLDKGDRIILDDDGWREYVVDSPQEMRDATSFVSTPHASNSVVTLNSSQVIEYFHETQVTPKRILDLITDGTEWYPDHDIPSHEPLEMTLDGVGGYQALLQAAELFGLEVTTRFEPDSAMTGGMTRYVGFTEPTGGRQTGLRFEYGRDLASVRRTFASRDVATRIYPYGASQSVKLENGKTEQRKLTIAPVNNGKTYLDADNLDQWGYPGRDGAQRQSVMVIDHTDIDTVASLFDQALKDLEEYSKPAVTYEAEITAFTHGGLYVKSLDAGDRVQIVDRTFTPPLRLDGRVTSIEKDLLSPEASTVTLGDVIETTAMQQAEAKRVARTVRVGKPIWDAATATASSAHSTATDAYNEATGLTEKVDTAVSSAATAQSTATAAQSTAASADTTAKAAAARVAMVGGMTDVTFTVAEFGDGLSVTKEVTNLPASMVAGAPPVRAQQDLWGVCQPIVLDHDSDESIPAGSIRVDVKSKPTADLVVRLAALKGATA